MKAFLDLLAEEIISRPYPHLLTVVFPNKRPALFLEKKLKETSVKPLIAPQIFSVTDFFSHVTGWKPAEKYVLLLTLFDVYAEVMQQAGLKFQAFDEFVGWGHALLNDFDEIDKFLVNPDDLLKTLMEIKEIEQWGVSEQSPEAHNYLTFFSQLPKIYYKFKERLSEQYGFYDGIIYRQAWETFDKWNKNYEKKSVILAGFNALTRVEEKIFKKLIQNGQADMFFDADQFYLEEPFEAGLFLRKNRKDTILGKDFKWIFDTFRKPKQFYTVHAPDDLSQIQFVNDKLLEWEKSGQIHEDFRLNTLIVLADTDLLNPFLYSLPPETQEVNISYSIPIKSMSSFQLLDLYIRFWINFVEKGNVNVQDFLFLIEHPFFPAEEKRIKGLKKKLWETNLKYIDTTYFFEEYLQEKNWRKYFLHSSEPDDLLRSIRFLIDQIALKIDRKSPERLALMEIDRLVEKIQTITNKRHLFDTLNKWYRFFSRLASEVFVYISGNPLKGYQVMGLLETRLLDFERIFILGMNEDILPGRKSNPGFIPYDLRKHFLLPVREEQSAVTAYHFYRLISRAKEVYLIYNTSTSGMSKGEPSRFIRQLEYLLPEYQNIYLQNMAGALNPPKKIEKKPETVKRLKLYFKEKGISASLINAYLFYTRDFFRRYVLGWEEKPELEDFIAANRMGNVIHESMESLYENYLGQVLHKKDFKRILSRVDHVVEKFFYEQYLNIREEEKKKNFVLKGKNILALAGAKEIVRRFVEIDRQAVEQGHELVIMETEKYVEFFKEIPGVGEVKFKGFIDRIDSIDGSLRVVDYKTGHVESFKKVSGKENNWDLTGIVENEKYKYQFQLYFYIWLVKHAKDMDKILRTGRFEPVIYTARSKVPILTKEEIDHSGFWEVFEEKLFEIIKEILNPDIPFELEKK